VSCLATQLLPIAVDQRSVIGVKTSLRKDDVTMGSTIGMRDRPGKLRLRVLLCTVSTIVLLGITAGTVCVFGLGQWLVHEDRLHPATAIAILSGNTPERALEAAQLYDDGYATEIWLTHPGSRVDALADLGINFPGEDEVNTRVLRRVGVPAKAIHVLDSPIVNTDNELEVISAALQKRGGHTVIIVTNRSHTRRVRLLWDKYYAARGEALVHSVSSDTFEPSHWWRYSAGVTQVMHEVMGIVNAWAGLPVQATPLPNSPVLATSQSVHEHAAAD